MTAIPRVGYRAVYYCPDPILDERILLGVLVKTGPGAYVEIKAPLPNAGYLGERARRLMAHVQERGGIKEAALGRELGPCFYVSRWWDLEGFGLADPERYVRDLLARRWPEVKG